MNEAIDYSTVKWVKQELDATLKQARQALEAHVESPADDSHLRSCAVHLHQVHGTLQMVELYGAALLAEEMEQVVESLLSDNIGQKQEAYELIMRAILQLPDYLERLIAGHRDVPLVLLPLLNDLRAIRGQKLLSENSLFSPDLDQELPDTALLQSNGESIQSVARKLRHQYQLALLGWFRGKDVETNLERLGDVVKMLQAACSAERCQRLWWVAGGLIAALRQGWLETSMSSRLLLGQIDRQIKKIVDEGETGLTDNLPNDLLKNMLFYVARASNGGEPVTLIKKTYNLGALLPDETELEHAQSSLSGHNAELMQTVSIAIREDMARVKDSLDLFQRGGRKTVAELQPAAETLARIGDTLSMLGLGAMRKVAQDQAQSAADMVAGKRSPEESALMDIAGALLYIESSLESLVQGGVPAQELSDKTGSTGISLPDTEFNQIRGVVADEAIRDISLAKDAFLAFMEESGDFTPLEKVPQLFHQIKGGLLLLNEQRAASLLDAAGNYIADQMLEAMQVPDDASLDDLADAISSVEYYLESLREGRMFSGTILDVAEQSMQRLSGAQTNEASVEEPDESSIGAEPEVDSAASDEGVIGQTAEVADSELEEELTGLDTFDSMELSDANDSEADSLEPATEGLGDWLVETESETDDFLADAGSPAFDAVTEEVDIPDITAEVPVEELRLDSESEVEPVMPVAESVSEIATKDTTTQSASSRSTPAAFAMSEDIDEEILEIFLEESEEELANINEFLPRWLSDESDQEALVDMRRSFHTLKGSGRLVGAIRIGEFAWAYENMLNRVIDGTVARTPVLCGLLERAAVAIPELIAQIRDGAETTQPIEPMAAMAQAYSQGESVNIEDLDGAATAITEQTSAVDEDVVAEEVMPVEPDLPVEEVVAVTVEAEPEIESPAEVESEIESGIDPILYDIFSNESRDHIATVRRFLDDCKKCGTECRITEDMLRAFHTLHGSARMAGADAIAEIAYEIEKYGKALRNDELPMPQDGMDAVAEAMSVIEGILEHLRALNGDTTEHIAIIETIARLPRTTENVEDIPSAEVPSESDDERGLGLEAVSIDLADDGFVDPFSADSEDDFNIESGEVLEIELSEGDDPFAQDFDIEDDLSILADGETDPFADFSESVEESSDTLDDVDVFGQPVEVDELPIATNDSLSQPESISTTYEVDRQPIEPVDERPPVVETPASVGIEEELVAFDYDDADQEMIEVFLEEGEEILEASDATLHKWIESPEDQALMAELQRHLHTLKGGARMANITAIGDLSHALESLLIAVVDDLVAPRAELFDVLLVAQDRLVNMIEAVRDQKPLRAATAVIDQLETLRQGKPISVAAPTAATPAAGAHMESADKFAIQKSAEPVVAGDAVSAELEAVVPVEEQKAAARTQQELVRVRADLLDNMVNYAGEISIYRSRLEQQVGSMRFNLSELGQTVVRIRDQLRKMEIETEAQVLFRYERETGSDDEQFDPLEMDRYSHLQQLSRSMGESISDLVSIQGLMDNITRESETLLLQQSRVNTELQEGLMRTRMVPFAGLAPRMRRIVRQASHELGKRAELLLEGTEGEMDRTVIDRIIAPIEHMLRNAIAHGIEMPEKRAAAGKRETGTIKVSLSRDGSEVVITLADDGAGMNLDAIKRKAKERGLLTEESTLSDSDIMQFVLETGFSTAETVSQISGRGVGMDVVNSEVKQLGGSLHIDSRAGQGTTFTIRLPFTLAISQALLVQVHDEIYAIPLTGVEGIVRINQDDLSRYLNDPTARFEYAGYTYPVNNLGAMLGHGAPKLGAGSPKRLPVLLVRSGDHRMALQVESLLGSREAVVKSVGPQISTVRGISGATILGDGRIVLILDLGGLLRSGGMTAVMEQVTAPVAQEEARPLLVMVVDDSITVRKVTTRLLERNEMEVVTAKDGVDAVAKLQEYMPDVMLLDIEMPRMDGFELATHIRNEPRLRHIPIIMITSRTGDKHRNRAMEIGVNRYLGKPFQESDLLTNISELTEERSTNG